MKALSITFLALALALASGCGKKPSDEDQDKKVTTSVVGEAPKLNGETLSLSVEFEATLNEWNQSFVVEKEHAEFDRSQNGLDCLAAISKGTHQFRIESGRMQLSIDRMRPQMNQWLSSNGTQEFQPWGEWHTSINMQGMQVTALLEIREGQKKDSAKITYSVVCQN